MSTTIENVLAGFADEMQQIQEHYAGLVKTAERAGFLRLARFTQAILASEAVRSRLILKGMQEHYEDDQDLFVCPHCGLIFIGGSPEKCPVDETPGSQFEKIE
jgi:rubrerythrin